MVQLDLQMKDGRVSMSLVNFEHIMNCLANQKFVGEAPPNGDAMAMKPEDYKEVQDNNQAAIDDCWKQGMDYLGRMSKK